MKEIGILFKSEMVRAILEDRKTQTRRIPTYMNTLVDGNSVGKKVWESFDFDFMNAHYIPDGTWGAPLGPNFRIQSKTNGTTHFLTPKWEIGDLFWVRETWRPIIVSRESAYIVPVIEYQADGEYQEAESEAWESVFDDTRKDQWRPGIHMFRWACRIEADITDVRAERIQEITDEDAMVEGVQIPVSEDGTWLQAITGGYTPKEPTFREHFIRLWDSINAKRGYDFASNWPVWVFGFGRRGK